MLDQMGQRYGLLPSEILTKGSTFDMVIMDISLTVENHNRNRNQQGYIPQVSTDELIKLKENIK